MSALATLFTAALSCAPALHPSVTEVYYDAPGDDTGHEFVEIWNARAVVASLAGVRLEAGDGGTPGRWTLRCAGRAGPPTRSSPARASSWAALRWCPGPTRS